VFSVFFGTTGQRRGGYRTMVFTVVEGESSSRDPRRDSSAANIRTKYVRECDCWVPYSTAPSERDRSPRAPGSLEHAYSSICSRRTLDSRERRSRAGG
jgi:hypothetical protein